MEVTRLKGMTRFGSYVVSIFEDKGKIAKVAISGKPHKDVADICFFIDKSKTRLTEESVKAIKITMFRHCEYKGILRIK